MLRRRTLSVERTLNVGCACVLSTCALAASATASATADPILAAAGDIACAPRQTGKPCTHLATANLVSSQGPSAVAVLGDNQYESGLLREFNGPGAYDDTWGRFNPIVHPALGNHEYAASPSAEGYF